MGFGTSNRIHIAYDEAAVNSMKLLCKASAFPDKAPISSSKPWEMGIEYSYLRSLKGKLENEWSWKELEKAVNKYEHFLVHYENGEDELDLHYVHVKSSREDAIPLILLHGWPGTFYDFHKVIDGLIDPENDKEPAFHVVIPSLPGYFKSTMPRREGWTLVDTARVMHGLMTEVLHYPKYAGQGGDWGSYILRIMGSLFPDFLPSMHFNMFRAPMPTSSSPDNLSETEKRLLARRDQFGSTGRGYLELQSTKPFTIGFAIASSPLAILAYIGEKIYSWSDPERVDQQDILDTVALYYLSGSFASSVVIYHQFNYKSGSLRNELTAEAGKWQIKGRIGYSAFPFEIGGATRSSIAAVGPLVYYKEHEHGGHFPALDSPEEFIVDMREFFGAVPL